MLGLLGQVAPLRHLSKSMLALSLLGCSRDAREAADAAGTVSARATVPVESGPPPRERAVVRVDLEKRLGPVNRNILGNNLETALDAGALMSKRGGGVWDPTRAKPAPGIVELMRRAGVSTLRYPGGCWVHYWDFRRTVGPLGSRTQKFGLPEYMRLTREVGAEPIVTLGVFGAEKTPEHYADLVEYLNGRVGENRNGGQDWAEVRAADGQREPWGVRWFEFGNEVFHGGHRDFHELFTGKVEPMSAETYVRRYADARNAMRRVDPSIQLAAILDNDSIEASPWSAAIIEALATQADYFVTHSYIPFGMEPGALSSTDRYRLVFAASSQYADDLAKLNARIRERAGRSVPLAITEHNVGLAYAEPPDRFSLGAAVHTADLVRLMLEPSSNVVHAQYWHLINGFWGMIQEGKQPRLRPAFHVFELFQRHLGTELVATSVESATFDTSGGLGVKPAFGDEQPLTLLGEPERLASSWQFDPSLGAKVTARVLSSGELQVTISSGELLNYHHARLERTASPSTGYRVCAELRSENLGATGARLQVGDARGWSATKSVIMSAPVTAAAWTRTCADYFTLADTANIEILARRQEDSRAGRFFVRNVSIQPYQPAHLSAVPVISAMATLRNSTKARNLSVFLVNRHLTEAVGARVPIATTRASAVTLAGQSPADNNEQDPERVVPKPLRVERDAGTLLVALPPHSFTVIEALLQP
jgi:alpha-N-arabinofuranosidase